jgi:phospholipase/carboxylesterase
MRRTALAEELLSCVEIEPAVPAERSVLWLHGLGADGHDFEPIVPHLGIDPGLAVRFVFPHAPRIPVTINMGLIMPAWYDLTPDGSGWRHDERGIRRSAEQVRALIARENARGVPTGRIVLAGFSQGGAIALHLGLRYEERFAGLLALSTYLVLPETVEAERSEANRGISIFQGHGEWDPMVPVDRGREAHERLVELGYDAEFRAYRMQHEVNPDEIAHVGEWLGKRLAAAG